jgi:hypothetical protein
VKTKLAEKWGELTLLWYCGLAQRQRAHEKGIYSWKRNNLAAQDIVQSLMAEEVSTRKKKKKTEVKKSRRRRIMESMINLNRTDDEVFRSVATKELEEPFVFIDPEKTQEFYVDFEVLPYVDILSDQGSRSSRLKQPDGIIYLIGTGWLCPVTKEWKFQSFVSATLTSGAELKMLNEWWNTIKTVKKQARAKKAVLYHWSPAEDRFLKRAGRRHDLDFIFDSLRGGRYEWRDMMDMFLEAEVVIRGVWGYSIKDVAKGLHKHGLLPAVWAPGEKGGDPIQSGEGTLGTATGAYRNAQRKGVHVGNVPQFASLRCYNEMDCRVLYDLLNFLREHIYCPRDAMIVEDEKSWQAHDSPISGKPLGTIWGSPEEALLLPPPVSTKRKKRKERKRNSRSLSPAPRQSKRRKRNRSRSRKRRSGRLKNKEKVNYYETEASDGDAEDN